LPTHGIPVSRKLQNDDVAIRKTLHGYSSIFDNLYGDISANWQVFMLEV
jgi:hypothetical protein